MELTIDQALQKAVEAHKAGQAQEADRLYTAILKAQPKHPDANHNLGVLAVSVGKAQEALPFLKTALEANPSIAQYWHSYIDALIKLDRIKEARIVLNQAKSNGANGDNFDKLEEQLSGASVVRGPTQDQVQAIINFYSQGQLQQAVNQANTLLKQFPNSATLFNIQGALLKGQGKLDSSIDAYKKALAIQPEYAEAYNNMGITLKDQGKLEEAIDAYKKALTLKPDYADAFYNMGIALTDQGKLEEATDAYKKTLAIQPDNAEAHNNMGVTLKDQGKLEEAINAYKKALTLKPDYADAHNNMGIALKDQGKLEEAINAYKKALAIKPDYAEAHNNMGNALQEHGKMEEAIEAYTRTLKIKPDYAEAKLNLAETLKIYSPKNNHRNSLIVLDNKIKATHNKHALPKIETELAIFTLNLLNELQSADKKLSSDYSQIFRRNGVDLNCKRHMQIFNEKEIIPKFCFGCYKVQVDVTTVLDLIRLAALFYEIEFESDLTRKCLIEIRPNIPGSYKGLIYCRGIDQAQSVKAQLDVEVRDLNKNLVAKIKRGCSEFPIAFPEYGQVATSEEEMLQYPQAWKALEVEFDTDTPIPPKAYVSSSLKEFCVSDYMIIQKWIDYAKGIGDPTSELFSDLPVKYDDIMKLGKARAIQQF